MFKFQRGCLELHSPMVCLVTVVVFYFLALLPAMTCRAAGRSIKPSNLVGYTTITTSQHLPTAFPFWIIYHISNWFIRMFSCVNLEGAYQQIHHAEKIPWHDHSGVIIWNQPNLFMPDVCNKNGADVLDLHRLRWTSFPPKIDSESVKKCTTESDRLRERVTGDLVGVLWKVSANPPENERVSPEKWRLEDVLPIEIVPF